MIRAAKMPERVWFTIAAIVAAALAMWSGYGCYSWHARRHGIAALSESSRAELAALTIPARATADVERSWVAKPSDSFLIASDVPMPCRTDQEAAGQALVASEDIDPVSRIERIGRIANDAPDNLLVALIYGTQLIRTGDYATAEQILAQALDRTDLDERIISAAKERDAMLDTSDVDVSTMVHIRHALSVAGLTRASDDPAWAKSLREVIGSVWPLSGRGLPGTARDQPVWSRLPIPAPGCLGISGRPTLSTYDLYNNLINGYMIKKVPVGGAWRLTEFKRRRSTAVLSMFLNAQIEEQASLGWPNESQLGALSNVETVINRVQPGVPDDARLALASVKVIDYWTQGNARELAPLRDQLITKAFQRRDVEAHERPMFAKDLLALLPTSGIARTSISNDAAAIREWLPAADAETLDHLLAADDARAKLPRWIVERGDDQEPPQAKLGSHASDWYSAALSGFASVAAQWAAKRSADEQRQVVIAIRAILGSAKAPPELVTLEGKLKWYHVLAATWWFWIVEGLLLALVLWLFLMWVLVHIRERRLLRTSFYNVELDALAASQPLRKRAP